MVHIKNTGTKIYYSDKSESSIEDLMDETPSNYNIPNGRLDGLSRGYRFGKQIFKKNPTGPSSNLQLDLEDQPSPKKNEKSQANSSLKKKKFRGNEMEDPSPIMGRDRDGDSYD
jgi:hypothetical protein